MASSSYPRTTVPVIELAGTPREMGLTHGRLAKQQIERNIRTYTSFFAETAGISWGEAKERSRLFVPVLERLYPEILEEMGGIAEGAGLEMGDVVTLNVRSEIALTNYEEDGAAAAVPSITDGCTSFAQLSADGSKLIVAQNWDWLEQLHDGIVFVDMTAKNQDGSTTRVRFLGEAGLVGKIGMNSHGVALCMNAIRAGAKDTGRLPMHVMARRVLQHARSTAHAVELLRDLGGACSSNFLVGDCTGAVANVEVTPRGVAVLRPQNQDQDQDQQEKQKQDQDPAGGVRAEWPSFVAHTNHLVSPPSSFARGPVVDHPAPNSFARLARIAALTNRDIERGLPLTVAAATDRLRDREGEPYSICRDRPPGAVGMEQMTTVATMVMEMDVVEGGAAGAARGRFITTIGRPCEPGLQTFEYRF